MVQDTACSPEIYLSRRDDGRVGGWGSYEHDDAGDDTKLVDYNLLRECNVVWAVSIPGQSSWCRGGSEVASTDSKPLLPHKYPHPSSPHLGLQVKVHGSLSPIRPLSHIPVQVYDSTFSESLRTTDLHSFVGVLTSDPCAIHSPLFSSVLIVLKVAHCFGCWVVDFGANNTFIVCPQNCPHPRAKGVSRFKLRVSRARGS
jgi:hypothetical protein